MQRTLIILGASNVTRGMASLVAAARSTIGEAMNLYVAAGHGRSYGTYSRVAARGLPGIVECGLWEAIGSPGEGRSCPPSRAGRGSGGGSNFTHINDQAVARNAGALPTPLPPPSDGGGTQHFALITDIGNDIMYGHAPGTIVQWIESCVDRLEARSANIIITGPPMETIRKLSRTRFGICKAILFPTRSLTFTQAMDRVGEFDRLLRELAAKRGLPLIEPRTEWYGFDPVHPLRRHLREAWTTYLRPWAAPQNPTTSPTPAPPPSEEWGIRIADRLRLRAALPQRFRIAGVPMGRTQPSAKLSDGTTVHTY